MIYRKDKTSCISFPLGGIGSGCIGLAGNGSLVDWEIFNSAAKGSYNGLTHFAVRAEEEGKVTDFRVLNGDLAPHYIGGYNIYDFNGFGYGPAAETLCNLPHFREHSFEGTYPVCRLKFGKEKFPAQCSLTAWSVLIPGESLPSSLPGAFFEAELVNNTKRNITYTVFGTICNPWSRNNDSSYNVYKNHILSCHAGNEPNDLSLAIDCPGSRISHQTYLYRGTWKDPLEIYYRDVLAGGDLKERKYEKEAHPHKDHGVLASRFILAPGEKKTVRFVITWSIPDRCMEERAGRKLLAEENHVKWSWKNYYATVWKNSVESSCYALKNYNTLREKTFCFRDAIFCGTLPEVVKEAAASNLAVLKSPTCLRLEDGTFYSWEGVAINKGSCEGSCTHVWNYVQALAFLFPDLERSMRESHLKYSIDQYGGSHFRLLLPLGIHATEKNFRPCADGQFADVMKIYRDWKIGGEDEYVRKYWKKIRKTVEFAWSKDNADQWDPEESGVLTGRQHHTLDVELYGANSWLTGHYLGGLAACAELADFMGECAFAEKCRKLFRKGTAFVNEKLFNGEYFAQSVDVKDFEILKRFQAEHYWSSEHKEIKYQIGDGCSIDAVLPQHYADLYGLQRIYDSKKYRRTLQSIYKYNYKSSMRDFTNLWRTYSVNDEAGVIICSWPRGNKPAIPLTYNSETMTGFEWAFAASLVKEGYIQKALNVAKSIRARFDGKKRNPYNEFECGNNYVRSMASYSLLPAFSGFRYDRREGMLGFAPKMPGKFQSFWALGELWGTFYQDETKVVLTLLHGSFTLKKLYLNKKFDEALLPVKLQAGDSLEIPLQ